MPSYHQATINPWGTHQVLDGKTLKNKSACWGKLGSNPCFTLVPRNIHSGLASLSSTCKESIIPERREGKWRSGSPLNTLILGDWRTCYCRPQEDVKGLESDNVNCQPDGSRLSASRHGLSGLGTHWTCLWSLWEGDSATAACTILCLVPTLQRGRPSGICPAIWSWPAASRSCCLDLAAVVDCTFELWASNLS